jgi:hypothetical protein
VLAAHLPNRNARVDLPKGIRYLAVQTQLNELLALVQLYRALGGGWVPNPFE